MALTDLDWDEELKRQAVISSLLAQPEVENQPDLNRVYDTAKPSSFETQTDEQVVAPPIVEAKDYHKVINQIFDTKTASASAADEQVTAPYGEKEKPVAPESDYAPKDTGKGAAPEDYPTIAQDQGGIEQAPDALNQVERASLVKLPPQVRRAELIDPDPDRNYFELNKADQSVTPMGDKSVVPGFVESSQNAILNPAAGVTPPTPVAPATTQLPNAPITPPAATQPANAPTTPPDQSKLQVAQPVVGGQGFFGGDLTQGPPGTKPNGTEDEPFWPKGDQDIALLPPGVNYIDPRDQSQKVTPGTPSATPAPSPAQLANAPVTAPSIIPAEDWQKTIDSIWPSADTKAKTAAAPTETGPLVNPDGTPFPTKVMAVGGEEPKALIIHHTGDHHTAAQTAQVLKDRGLGVEYTIDRDGNLVQIGDSGASNILPGWGPKGTGLNNRNIVGVEVAANDDKDVTPAQVATLVKLGRMYPNVQVLGHGEVNPGHKEADEGATGVKAIMADRASGSQTGEPGTTPIETLVKLDQSGVNVTHFGYEKSGEEGYDPDSAAGHGKYVKDLIPGYDVALNSAGAALVGNPKPGETFQFAGKEFRYGDAVSEKLTDPRFDIFDPTGTALTGSMPVGRQVSTPAGPEKQPWDDWVKLSPDEQAATEAKIETRTQAKAQAENAAVYKLPEAQNSNIIGLYNRLETSVPDVSDQTRSQIQAKLKPEIIAQMRAKFPEIKTDDEAWAKAQSPVNALDVGQDWGSKAIGFVQQFTEPMKVGAANTDQFSVDQFLNKAMPNASDADKHNYLTKLYGMPIDQRASEIAGRLGPGFVQPGNPYRDPYFLAQALDRLSNPNFQKRQADDVAKFQEEMKRNVSSDPRLVDTGMDRIVNDTAQIPAAVAAFSNPALWPMALAQVHEQVSDGFKKEHPEWDAKTLQEKSTYATLTQFFGGLVAGHVMSAGAGALMEGIEGKAQRAIAQAVFGGTSQAAIGGLTQTATNVIAGDPLSKGTGEATLSGLIQGTTTGVGHGVGELAAPEAKPVEPQLAPLPETKLPEPAVPQTHDEIVASALEAARVQAEPGEPVTARAAQIPVTLDEAIQKAKADSVAAQLGGTPRVVGADERGNVRTVQQGRSSARVTVREMLNAGGDSAVAAQKALDAGHGLNDPMPKPGETAGTGFPTQAHANVYNDLVARGMDEGHARDYVSKARGATQADILTDVQTQMRGSPPPPRSGPVGESDPYLSKVANRYMVERVASGEIAPIEPGHGDSPEEMLSKASKMTPGQVDQYVSNVMHNVGGDPKMQAAAIRLEEFRLSQRNLEAGRAYESNPNPQTKATADEALADLNDFHNNPLAKIKSNFHHMGVLLRGERAVDLASFNGQRDAWLRNNAEGKRMSPATEKAMKDSSNGLRDAMTKEKNAIKEYGDGVEKLTQNKKQTAEETRLKGMKKMGFLPCP